MKENKPRRLKLIDNYSAGSDRAFGDSRLEEIKNKIKKISSSGTSTETEFPKTGEMYNTPPDTTPDISPDTSSDIKAGTNKKKIETSYITSPNTTPDTSPLKQHNNAYSNREPISQPVDQPITQSVATPDTIPIASPDTSPDTKPVCLNENQFVLYHCLRMIKGKITTLPLIKKETKISENTLKGNLNKLRKEKVIDYKGRQHAGSNKFGFIGIVLNKQILLTGDKDRAIKILKGINHENLILTIHSIPDPIPHLTSNLTPHQTLLSSSSFIERTTTNDDLESILAIHPELGYWRQKGLTPKQVMEWIKVTDCEPELMVQYLCYCRYEMVDLNLEESKPVNNVFNWFFKILEKTGFYPKPKDYKSHEEKRLEAEQTLIADREKQIQKLKELHRKKYEQERDLEFWNMMNNPDSELYKQCFDNLNDFAKGKARKGGKVFESAMRKAFDEIWDL